MKVRLTKDQYLRLKKLQGNNLAALNESRVKGKEEAQNNLGKWNASTFSKDQISGRTAIMQETAKELDEIMKDYEIIAIPTEEVGIGSIVEVKLSDEEEPEIYEIWEKRPVSLQKRNTQIAGDKMEIFECTIDAPFVKAIIGKKPGDEFSYVVGKVRYTGNIVKLFDIAEPKIEEENKQKQLVLI